MAKFRRKVYEIEAIQWDGSKAGLKLISKEFEGFKADICKYSGFLQFYSKHDKQLARGGDWIIKGADGEFHISSASVFADQYEPVEAGA